MAGEGNPAPGSRGVYGENEAYDPGRNSWRRLPPMPIAKLGTAAATVGRSIYVPGGAPQTRLAPTDSTEIYRPQTRRRQAAGRAGRTAVGRS